MIFIWGLGGKLPPPPKNKKRAKQSTTVHILVLSILSALALEGTRLTLN